MKVIIFAGGSGTRLWPLSRKKSPKQFEKIIGNKSTLQLTVERLKPDIGYKDIYISTNIIYKKIVEEELPSVPKENFFYEPEKRDLGPAIAMVSGILKRIAPEEPMVILWCDHLVKRGALFRKILKVAANYIEGDGNKIIFIGHKPRFISTNLGYIHLGKKLNKINNINFYKFEGFKYRPDERIAEEFFKSGHYAWNLGYFITTASFIYEAFRRLAPTIYKNTEKILTHFGKSTYKAILKKNYGKVESMNFDNAILENLDKDKALVIMEDIGWSDIGAWEALKEALENHPYENVIRGEVHLEHVRDSLIYNYEDKKLIVGIELDEMIIVNTEDALLITKKTSVGKIKNLVENLQGTRHEKLT